MAPPPPRRQPPGGSTPDSSLAAHHRSLLASHVRDSRPLQALRLFTDNRRTGARADAFALPTVLKACARARCPRLGAALHAYSLKSGLADDAFVRNSLLHLHSACGHLHLARRVFDEMPHRDAVAWSALVGGYSRSRCFREALSVVGELLRLSRPSEIAMLNMVALFARVGDPATAKAAHAYVLRTGGTPISCSDHVMGTSLVDMYAKCGCTGMARKVFDAMPERKSVASWTAMIAGLIRSEEFADAAKLLGKMRAAGVPPNSITLLSLLAGCGEALELGELVHAYALRNDFPLTLRLATALVDMYGKCGECKRARAVFDRMCGRDVTAWTAMIAGYARSSRLCEAVEFIGLMKVENLRPDETTIVSLLSACAQAGALDMGKWLHACIDEEGGRCDVILKTALIDMYSKSGDVVEAYRVFSSSDERDVCMWNAMIHGLALHGSGNEALELFGEMVEEGFAPNDITFVGVLHACGHSGLVREGRRMFKRMEQEFGVAPKVEHYGCMVDLLARAGHLDEALEMIHGMPVEPNVAIWGALLAGCKMYRSCKITEEAALNLMMLEPGRHGYNVLLSNIHAMRRRWSDVVRIRRGLERRGVKKVPGLSSVEVNGSLYEFATGDELSKEGDEMLMDMHRGLRDAGYAAIASSDAPRSVNEGE